MKSKQKSGWSGDYNFLVGRAIHFQDYDLVWNGNLGHVQRVGRCWYNPPILDVLLW